MQVQLQSDDEKCVQAFIQAHMYLDGDENSKSLCGRFNPYCACNFKSIIDLIISKNFIEV